jgi:hypothetical protein
MLLFSHRMPSRLRADTLNSRGFPSRGAAIESRGGACPQHHATGLRPCLDT